MKSYCLTIEELIRQICRIQPKVNGKRKLIFAASLNILKVKEKLHFARAKDLLKKALFETEFGD